MDNRDKQMGLRIKQLRKEKGWTQADLAQRVGLQDSAIAKYECGRSENMKRSIIAKMSDIFNVSPLYLMALDDNRALVTDSSPEMIPVFSYVSAGNGVFASENIDQYIPMPPTLNKKYDEYFGLKVRGDSMTPDIQDGDIVIVKKQYTAKDGDTVIALVNGDEGYVKKFMSFKGGITLVSNNPSYKPRIFTTEEVDSVPVKILGIVKQLVREM